MIASYVEDECCFRCRGCYPPLPRPPRPPRPPRLPPPRLPPRLPPFGRRFRGGELADRFAPGPPDVALPLSCPEAVRPRRLSESVGSFQTNRMTNSVRFRLPSSGVGEDCVRPGCAPAFLAEHSHRAETLGCRLCVATSSHRPYPEEKKGARRSVGSRSPHTRWTKLSLCLRALFSQRLPIPAGTRGRSGFLASLTSSAVWHGHSRSPAHTGRTAHAGGPPMPGGLPMPGGPPMPGEPPMREPPDPPLVSARGCQGQTLDLLVRAVVRESRRGCPSTSTPSYTERHG